MGTTTYYVKNTSIGQNHGLTEIYPSTTAKMVLIIGHGIGERSTVSEDENLYALKRSSGWSGWGDDGTKTGTKSGIKGAADTYGIIQIYISTTHDYEFGEYQFAVSWAKKKYAALSLGNKIWVLGHSLGSFGLGKYAMRDSTFPPQIAGWIMSASGNFLDGSVSTVWNAIVNNGLKVWGVTAENDTCKNTDPVVITTMYSAVKAINSSAHVMKSVFPDTEWDCPTSHNAVLGRITNLKLPYYSGGNFKLITTGELTSNDIVMNIYQWMRANPRTSNYVDPTVTYNASTMPSYTTNPDTTVEIKDFNLDPRIPAILLTWKDSTSNTIKPATGDSITNIYIRKNSSNQLLITITYAVAPAKTYGPYKA